MLKIPEDKEELSEEAKRNLKIAEEQVKRGEVVSAEELFKKLNL